MTRVNGALIDIPDDEVDTLLNHERELERGALHRRLSRRLWIHTPQSWLA